MKTEELSTFDWLVLQKMRELLAVQYRISVAQDRKEIIAIISEVDDAGLNELSYALRRIEKGTYGQCVICRHEIPTAILESNLTARLCPSCQMVMHEKIEDPTSGGNTSV